MCQIAGHRDESRIKTTFLPKGLVADKNGQKFLRGPL
jgi:hypothetical protein